MNKSLINLENYSCDKSDELMKEYEELLKKTEQVEEEKSFFSKAAEFFTFKGSDESVLRKKI